MPIDWGELLAGAGLLGGSYAGRDEQGFVSEARQFLRNRFTSPGALPGEFTSMVDQFQGQFEPFFAQTEKRYLDDVQQRAGQGLPSSFTPAMGGAELRAIRDAVQNELLPRRQAFQGELGLQLLNARERGAGEVLRSGRQDELSGAVGELGGSTLLNALLGGSGGFLQGGADPVGALLKLLGLGGGGTGGGTSGGGFLQNGLAKLLGLGTGGVGTGGAALQGIANMFPGAGALTFQAIPGSQNLLILGESGQSLGVLNSSGQVISAATGQPIGAASPGIFGTLAANAAQGWGTGVGQGFGAMTGSFGGLLSGFGTVGGGFLAGKMIGPNLPNQLTGTLGGAAGGAATGALMGTMIFPGIGTALGAILGGLGGAGGGFLGKRGAQVAMKAQRLSADQKSQANDVSALASFWTEALGAAGFEGNDLFPQGLDSWKINVDNWVREIDMGPRGYFDGVKLDQQDAVAYGGAKALLWQIQQSNPEITSLSQVPGFRDRYIQFIMGTTQIESGGRVVPTQNIGQKMSYLTNAGL